jgi:YHS domain-containing protein
MLIHTLALALTLAAAPQVNDRCPVTGLEVTNHRLHHHLTLKGHTYFVHDREAANRLRQCPGCYLAADGTPLNAQALQTPGTQVPR